MMQLGFKIKGIRWKCLVELFHPAFLTVGPAAVGGIGGCIDLTLLTDDEDDDRPLIVDITSPDPARRNLVPNDLNPVVVRDNVYL